MDEVSRITPDVSSTIDHLFRRESGKVVAALARQFGLTRIDFAEDIVQDVLVTALEIWPKRGMPDRPLHWMITTARNRTIDAIRKNSLLLRREDEISEHLSYLNSSPTFVPFDTEQIEDDTLRMIFACSHPSLSRESQIILILRLLFGFRTLDIAHAINIEEAAATKRLVRAKEKFRSGELELISGAGFDLTARIGSVLNALYLTYALGTNRQDLRTNINQSICEDSIYLLRLVLAHPSIDDPRADALLALMYFRSSSMSSPTDYLPLADAALLRSARGESISVYHLEAAIAAEYAHNAEPDLRKLLELYDVLILLSGDERTAAGREAIVQKLRASATHHRQ